MKFRLVENVLNEAFSPSMPSALNKWLSSQKSAPGYNYAVRKLMNLGIDPASAEFTEIPIPTTNRDPFFKIDDKVKVLDFGDKGFYIQGVNDDTEFLRPDGKWQPAKYLPAKSIMGMAEHIYLVDPTLTSGELAATKDKRRTIKKELSKSPYNRVNPGEVSRARLWDPSKKYDKWDTVIDKSGYIVNPNRLKDKLLASGIFKPEKKIQTAYDSIVTTRNYISSLIPDIMSRSGERMDTILSTQVRSAMSDLGAAAKYYNYMIDVINNYNYNKSNNNGKVAPDDLRRYKQELDDNASNVKSYIDDAMSYISSFIGTVVDWDTDEDDI